MSDSQSCDVPETWITSFCSLRGNEYFVEISEDFIEDEFNLTGLQPLVAHYREALDMILDIEPISDTDTEDDDSLAQDGPRYDGYHSGRNSTSNVPMSEIERSAQLLYGLIHQRYIITRPGLEQMREKYENRHFGHCPRVNCRGAHVLPHGRTDAPMMNTVKLFCPSCLDLYTPQRERHQNIDGAFFGTTFACMFLLTYPDLIIPRKALSSSNSEPADRIINGYNSRALAPAIGEGKIYTPRIYGFRVSEYSATGPRMRWLRSKPANLRELDETAIFHQNGGNSRLALGKAVDNQAVCMGGPAQSTSSGLPASPSEATRETTA